MHGAAAALCGGLPRAPAFQPREPSLLSTLQTLVALFGAPPPALRRRVAMSHLPRVPCPPA
ncbi:hypothetical protein C8Q79DRAFT_982341 [Trametes meyenii]|nr:hypothetical protein C8Q79DRAFT_982341 [Trametes meyenii]